MNRPPVVLLLVMLVFAGCSQAARDEAVEEPVVLGPADGRDLPGTDLERVRIGELAPDFTLQALGRPPVTLSDFRGSKNVVLVFYRGHW